MARLARAGLHSPFRAALVVLLAAASLLLAAASAQAQAFPKLTGRVVDAANIIPDDVEARLNQKLAGLETQSQRQLVVATLPSLEGYEISDYGYRLGREWGIGSKERNDGALLIVAPSERKLRIEVGYGLEGILTDGLSSIIINDTIVPKFKQGDMPGGIEAGVDALITQLTLPEGEARIAAAQAQAPPASPENSSTLVTILFFGFVFFITFVAPMLRAARRMTGYRPSGIGPVVLWGVIDALASARTSSGSSSSGGGGFSGGGGSFGGGGSSGSW